MKQVIAILAPVVLVACVEAEMPVVKEGQQRYGAYCAICHGANGTGNGAAAANLKVTPADLTVLARNNAGAFPTSAVLSQIDGYFHLVSEERTMPEYGALFKGDLVPVETDDGVMTPTPRPLAALVVYLESIQE